MIVKTGANYQTEGGYIEASRDGDGAIVTINGKTNEIISMDDVPLALVNTTIRKTTDMTASIAITYFYEDSVGLHNGTLGVTTVESNVLMLRGCLIFFGVTPETAVKLVDGSRDCEIIKSSGRYYLNITGNNPVCIMGVDE